jgi:hypothetical protein
MIQHIATGRYRSAGGDYGASGAFGTTNFGFGDLQAGPNLNDIPQGECIGSISGAAIDTISAAELASIAMEGRFGPVAVVIAAVPVLVEATAAAFKASQSSPQCLSLDNAAKVNQLGISAMSGA